MLGCKVLQHCLEELAGRYPHVRFLSMLATDCIPGYPDTNLPTVLVYHDGACARTLVGLRPFGGSRLSPESAPPPSLCPYALSPCAGDMAARDFASIHGQLFYSN